MTAIESRDGEVDVTLTYRLLTGTDDRAFCERVSRALENGYKLYGNPSMTVQGDKIVVAQAVILDADGPQPAP